MAQNHDKKFDATAAQLLWLKENLYSRCCEYTIHFSDLRENKGTKLLGDQEITNISKNVGSQLQTNRKIYCKYWDMGWVANIQVMRSGNGQLFNNHDIFASMVYRQLRSSWSLAHDKQNGPHENSRNRKCDVKKPHKPCVSQKMREMLSVGVDPYVSVPN